MSWVFVWSFGHTIANDMTCTPVSAAVVKATATVVPAATVVNVANAIDAVMKPLANLVCSDRWRASRHIAPNQTGKAMNPSANTNTVFVSCGVRGGLTSTANFGIAATIGSDAGAVPDVSSLVA